MSQDRAFTHSVDNLFLIFLHRMLHATLLIMEKCVTHSDVASYSIYMPVKPSHTHGITVGI